MTAYHRTTKTPQGWTRPRIRWPRELADSILVMQDGRCACCGRPIRSEEPRNLDHVRPRCRGGEDALGNLTVVHRACNIAKGEDWPTGCQLIFVGLVNEALGLWERPETRATAAPPPDAMLARLKSHPGVAPVWAGGEIVGPPELFEDQERDRVSAPQFGIRR